MKQKKKDRCMKVNSPVIAGAVSAGVGMRVMHQYVQHVEEQTMTMR